MMRRAVQDFHGAAKSPRMGGTGCFGHAWPGQKNAPGDLGPHGGRTGLMDFRVQLQTFRGPLDLLLYLVRRYEIPITEVSLAEITDQFVAHLEVLKELDLGAVGEFLEVASILVEIKSRRVLPRVETEESDLVEEPHELVQRLLEYKQYRDAASLLEDQAALWQQRYPRIAPDAPHAPLDPAEQPIREVELWDLVSAFTRIMRDAQAVQPPSIVYDDTPLDVYMDRIRRCLLERPRVPFSELFEPGLHKSALIGIFLAMLELVRHHGVVAEQPDGKGEIWLARGPSFEAP